MDTVRIIFFVVDIIVLIAIAYVVFFITPYEDKILRDCNIRLMCKEKMIKGKICDPYEMTDYKGLNETINITI